MGGCHLSMTVDLQYPVCMILACPSCARQYRVDRYPAGQRVRCMCGHPMTVPEPRPHEARILHCADCGGPLGADATACDYCGGVLDPNQRHYTLLCPRCYARLPEQARFCIECATRIHPQEVVTHREGGHRCPRDGAPLQARAADDVPFEECPQCLGLWLSAEDFKRVCERKTREYRDNPLPSANGPTTGVEPVVYLKCPRCQQIMNRQNFGRRSGIIIDTCVEHGVWLDDRELERIARFIAEGGLARSRQQDTERLEAQARAAARRAQGSRRYGPSWGTGVAADSGLFEGFLDVLGSWFD